MARHVQVEEQNEPHIPSPHPARAVSHVFATLVSCPPIYSPLS